jgi:hypothetical protein
MSRVIGVAWFRPDEWQRLRDLSTDAHKLEPTYEAWAEIAFRESAKLASSGVEVIRIDVGVDELAAWCQEEGRPLDAQARAAFAAERLRLMHEAS